MSKKRPSEPKPVPASRLEKNLAIAIVVIVAVSIVCFFSVVIATAIGAAKGVDFAHGIWPVVFTIQYWGLPVAFLLLVILLVTNSMRRTRNSRVEK